MSIEDLLERRVKDIWKRHPVTSVDNVIQEGDYGKLGVILHSEYDLSVMGFDFNESEPSWKRPDAVRLYNNLVEDGYCVVVYVPESVKNDAAEKLRKKGGRSNIG